MSYSLIVSLSPRKGGNSDAAADMLAGVVPGPCRSIRLREYDITPCTGCGACARGRGCVFADMDRVEELFALLDGAARLWLCAPVYFYHLPAHAKAWIDRAQSRYVFHRQIRPGRPRREARAVVIAGRPRGENLFGGILLTLRYFLDVFDYELVGQVLLRGLDAPGDLREDSVARTEVIGLGGGVGNEGR